MKRAVVVLLLLIANALVSSSKHNRAATFAHRSVEAVRNLASVTIGGVSRL